MAVVTVGIKIDCLAFVDSVRQIAEERVEHCLRPGTRHHLIGIRLPNPGSAFQLVHDGSLLQPSPSLDVVSKGLRDVASVIGGPRLNGMCQVSPTVGVPGIDVVPATGRHRLPSAQINPALN